jgi:hypothetical protein
MFMPPASPSGFRLFRNSSLHSSIHNFLLVRISAVMFRELKLVRGMRAERATALGGCFAPQGGYPEKPPA